METIEIVMRDGAALAVPAHAGASFMQLIRDGGDGQMLALCGGCCSCGTCHVYVDDEALPRLPPPSADELDMLESLGHRQPGSRLACQLRYSASLAGLRLQLAPEE